MDIGLTRIGFHSHCVNARDALISFKDQFWSTCMMQLTPVTDSDVRLWKVCYNSQSQDINSHAKIETSCCTIQSVEWSDALVDIDVYIPLRKWMMLNDVEENLHPTIFDVTVSTIIFCNSQNAWNWHTLQQTVTLKI